MVRIVAGSGIERTAPPGAAASDGAAKPDNPLPARRPRRRFAGRETVGIDGFTREYRPAGYGIRLYLALAV